MINITLSFPETILQQIDLDRGDINRSKYIIKLLRVGYEYLERQNQKNRHAGRTIDETCM